MIVSSNDPSSVAQLLRQWFRNEHRLGVRHVGVQATMAADDGPAAPAPPSKGAPARPDTPRSAVKTRPPTAVDRPTTTAGAPTLPIAPDHRGLPPFCTESLSADEARAELARLDTTHVKGCEHCELCAKRTQTVFGVGHPRAELVFVGEGPGADEDRQGEPFVGMAGQLLTRMIAAMTLTREQVYICNVVKCRPPGNRTPQETEMEACSPYLWRQLAIIRPKAIVALGRPASQTLLASKAPIGKLRGNWYDFPPPGLSHLEIPPCRLMPTFHPAYLLRSPGEKRKVWEDLQQVMSFLGIELPS